MKIAITMATLLLAAGAARAETLAGWNFWGLTTTTATSLTQQATAQSSGLQGTVTLSFGAGVANTGAGASPSLNAWWWRNRSASLAAALTANRYITFTLTPAPGNTITVTNFSCWGSRATAVATGTLFSAVGGFSEGGQIGEAALAVASAPSPAQSVISAGAGVSFTAAQEFRLYLTGNNASAGGRFGDSDTDLGDVCILVEGTAEADAGAVTATTVIIH
jgi:hypothetical protein